MGYEQILTETTSIRTVENETVANYVNNQENLRFLCNTPHLYILHHYNIQQGDRLVKLTKIITHAILKKDDTIKSGAAQAKLA